MESRIAPFRIRNKSFRQRAEKPDALKSIKRFACLLTLILTTTTACTSWIPVGSGGGRSEGITPRSGEFSLAYENEVSFDSDLSASVDAAFARTRADDPSVTATLVEFARPGHILLAEQYGIILEYKLIGVRNQPDTSPFRPGNIIFAADLESAGDEWQSNVEPVFTDLVSDCADCVFRMRIDSGEAQLGFDPKRPRQLAVNTRLNFLLEGTREPGNPDSEWFDVRLDRKRVSRLADKLRKQLNKVYYKFLTSKGVETTTGFRGIE